MPQPWDEFIAERGVALNDLSLREILRQFHGWLEARQAPAQPGQAAYGPAWLVEWLESEAGWGVRPDGASLHRTKEQSEDFVKAYWDRMPSREDLGGGVPHEYSRPIGPGGPVLIDAELRRALADGKDPNGIRVSESDLRRWTREEKVRKAP